MAIQPGLVTAEELMALPDDGLRRELVRGEVRKTPPTGTSCQSPSVPLHSPEPTARFFNRGDGPRSRGPRIGRDAQGPTK